MGADVSGLPVPVQMDDRKPPASAISKGSTLDVERPLTVSAVVQHRSVAPAVVMEGGVIGGGHDKTLLLLLGVGRSEVEEFGQRCGTQANPAQFVQHFFGAHIASEAEQVGQFDCIPRIDREFLCGEQLVHTVVLPGGDHVGERCAGVAVNGLGLSHVCLLRL
jgi:hypothetical protein